MATTKTRKRRADKKRRSKLSSDPNDVSNNGSGGVPGDHRTSQAMSKASKRRARAKRTAVSASNPVAILDCYATSATAMQVDDTMGMPVVASSSGLSKLASQPEGEPARKLVGGSVNTLLKEPIGKTPGKPADRKKKRKKSSKQRQRSKAADNGATAIKSMPIIGNEPGSNRKNPQKPPHRPANGLANKQVNKQASKQVSMQADKRAQKISSKKLSESTGKQASKPADTPISTPAAENRFSGRCIYCKTMDALLALTAPVPMSPVLARPLGVTDLHTPTARMTRTQNPLLASSEDTETKVERWRRLVPSAASSSFSAPSMCPTYSTVFSISTAKTSSRGSSEFGSSSSVFWSPPLSVASLPLPKSDTGVNDIRRAASDPLPDILSCSASPRLHKPTELHHSPVHVRGCTDIDVVTALGDFYQGIDTAYRIPPEKTAKKRSIERYKQAILEADCDIMFAHRRRSAAAAKLQRLGVPTILYPRSRGWLRVKMVEERTAFLLREEVDEMRLSPLEDYPDDCKATILRIMRMRMALRSEFQFDSRGFIDRRGRYAPFDPSPKEMLAFSWDWVEEFWEDSLWRAPWLG